MRRKVSPGRGTKGHTFISLLTLKSNHTISVLTTQQRGIPAFMDKHTYSKCFHIMPASPTQPSQITKKFAGQQDGISICNN